ncbi:SDR family oxidoreductase [Coraliomargarita akajimensis]|nr:SDR family oxidoreductase [Coraliomargarita akajimensis]
MRNIKYGPKGWTPERIDSLAGNTYLITGANSGTGYQASKILLSKGARVVMLNRNLEKSAQAIEALKQALGDPVDVSVIRMDLGDLASVRKAAEAILEAVPRIDALICNGAIAQVPQQRMTVDGFESQLGVNHYGHFLLQGLLFPRIEASAGRIVVVGSEGYKMGIRTMQFDDMNWDRNYHANRVYSQSKLAQIMTVYELQRRLHRANTMVKAYACHPGASATSLIKTSGSRMMRVIWYLMTLSPFVQSAERGAYPEVMCATEDDLNQEGFYGPTGWNYWTGPVGECVLESHALDQSVAERLWVLSEKETGCIWGI